MAVNVTSLVTTLHHALPYLRQSPTGCGKAVFVSSGASVGNTASWGAYNASKAAMNAVARTLATEEEQVAVWSVRPGVVSTSVRSCHGNATRHATNHPIPSPTRQMQEQLRSTGKDTMSPADYDRFLKMHADGKLLKPEQPGHVLAALAVKGTRAYPTDADGSGAGAGEKGAFVNWNDTVMADFQLP